MFAPFAALVGQVLRGQVVVDSTALVSFFLSLRGFSALLMSAIIFITLRFMENAGLSVLVAAQSKGMHISALSAFKHVMVRSTALLRATFLIIVAAIVLLIPFCLLAKYFAHQLLSQHDINYYLHAKPNEFIHAAAILSIAALMTLSIGLWWAIRWRWVAQILMFEQGSVLHAFRQSAGMAQPVWLSIAWRWGALGLVNLILGACAAWMGRLFLPMGLGVLGNGKLSLGFILGGLWIMQALIGAFFTMIGAVLEAHVFTNFYLRCAKGPIQLTIKELSHNKQMNWWMMATVWTILILVGGGVGSVWGSGALFSERPMLVIAHRGSLNEAPENTIPSFENAIRDGADVLELDVQLSKDGVMVVQHDSDFSRMGGVAKRVSDLTWKEIKAIDVGRAFDEKFKGTHPARLEDVLHLSRNRVRLNIEPKYYGPIDGKLEEKIVQLIEQKGMVDHVEIQSLEFNVIETVRRRNPKIPIGYLLSVNARKPEKLPVDFLSAQASRVDARFLRRAHKHGLKVYVWTVDDEEQMEKVQALGVDGLITNQSKRARAFINRWATLTPNDKALRRLKFWLAS